MRAVDEEEIAWVDGLPITKAERTLVDLCLDFEDPSLIGDALRDAARIKGEEKDVCEATEPGRALFNVVPNGEASERRWTHDGFDWE